jgi:hypothetical protein
MATEVLTAPAVTVSSKTPEELGWFSKLIVRRVYPTNLVLRIVAFMWALYLLAQHQWIEAIVVAIVLDAVGALSARKLDPQLASRTRLGKCLLLFLKPQYLILYVIGVLALLYGVWMHDTVTTLAGVSLMLFGQMFVWSKVIFPEI